MKDSRRSMHGKTVLITGANTGIGYALAAELASQGAHLVLACRDSDKSRRAVAQLQRAYPLAKISLVPLDLTNPAAVTHAAQDCRQLARKLDALVLNAAIMAPPFGLTPQGFEQQLAVNHIGHYLLAGLLLDCLKRAENAVVVTVTSQAAMDGRIDWEDPHFRRRPYDAVVAYRQSKLANLLFAVGLGDRLARHGLSVRSCSADPGYCRTDLQRHAQGWLRRLHVRYTQARYAHPAQAGAIPILAAMEDVGGEQGTSYRFGANQALNLKALADHGSLKDILQDAERLWLLTEEWTEFKYNFHSL